MCIRDRYRGIKYKKEYSLKSLPEFPIYLIFDDDKISFYFHGLTDVEKSESTPNSDASNLLDPNDKNNFHLHHYELFSLSFSEKLRIKNNVTETVRSLLHEEVRLQEKIFEINPSTTYLINYSNLENVIRFSTNNEEKGNPLFLYSEEKEMEGLLNIYKHKLLLDFLFDLKHSNVFENSPFHAGISSKLRLNNLLKAISSKFDYYYSRDHYLAIKEENNLIRKQQKEIQLEIEELEKSNDKEVLTNAKEFFVAISEKKSANEKIRLEWSDRLQSAEKQWVNTIISKESTEEFYFSGGWMNAVEKELKGVLFNDHLFKNYFDIFQWKIVQSISKNKKIVSGIFLILIFMLLSLLTIPYNDDQLFQIFFLSFASAFFCYFIILILVNRANITELKSNGQVFERDDWQDWRRKKQHEKAWENEQLELYSFHKNINNFFLSRYNILQCYRFIIKNNIRPYIATVIFLSLIHI